jgi:hypothetical protein
LKGEARFESSREEYVPHADVTMQNCEACEADEVAKVEESLGFFS